MVCVSGCITLAANLMSEFQRWQCSRYSTLPIYYSVQNDEQNMSFKVNISFLNKESLSWIGCLDVCWPANHTPKIILIVGIKMGVTHLFRLCMGLFCSHTKKRNLLLLISDSLLNAVYHWMRVKQETMVCTCSVIDNQCCKLSLKSGRVGLSYYTALSHRHVEVGQNFYSIFHPKLAFYDWITLTVTKATFILQREWLIAIRPEFSLPLFQ